VNGGLRQSMAWLHTWTGLVFGWVLYAMFLTGTASYFRPEITRWMEPETGRPAAVGVSAQAAIAYLQRAAPDARSWTIQLPDERASVIRVAWRHDPKPGETRAQRQALAEVNRAALDAATGAVVRPRDTRGGEFFYRFHFQLHYLPVLTGRWVAGLAAMFMLTAIVTGVITHKRIFKDLFTFRPAKGGQRAWLDAHNVMGVLALPFHLMITYTGLVLLMGQLMPWGVVANYQSPAGYFAAAFPHAPEPQPSGRAAPLAPVAPMLAEASRAWGGGRAWIVTVRSPGDAAAIVEVERRSGDEIAYRSGSIGFSGVSGARIFQAPPEGPASQTDNVMGGLHMARFAGAGLRWTYFLCGLAGAAMTATGLVLWTVKRRRDLPDPTRPHLGFRLVERLNIGTVAGVPAGMAAMLWANRLLPANLASRAAWEVNAMFLTWGAAVAWACLRPARRAWAETLWAAAGLVALTPLVSALTSPRNLARSLADGDWAMAAFDGTLAALGAGLAVCAAKASAGRAT
jgi:uncharacterized iron-regulated membrane protein